MRRNEHLDFVTAEFKALGIPYETHRTGGGHIGVRWQVPGKEPRSYTVPSTPSDGRGRLNARSVIRNLLRQDGAIRDRKAVEGPRPVGELLARALELPRHTQPLPEQIADLRAEIADLTETVTGLATILAQIRDKIKRPAPLPPPAPEPIPELVKQKSKKDLFDFLSRKWISLDALARDMEQTTKQVYARCYYHRAKVEVHKGSVRLRQHK